MVDGLSRGSGGANDGDEGQILLVTVCPDSISRMAISPLGLEIRRGRSEIVRVGVGDEGDDGAGMVGEAILEPFLKT
jgi:hypothetical protein